MDTVKIASDARRKARSVVGELRSLSSSFAHTGNDVLADSLDSLADEVESSAEDAYNAHSALLNDMISSTQQATANMLSAALAGIVVSNPKKRKQ